MTDMALLPLECEAPAPGAAPVRPAWLRPAAIAAVIAAHAGAAWLMTAVALQPLSPLDSITMDLVAEGDFFEQQEVTAAKQEAPPQEAAQPDLAMPSPAATSPESPPLPAKKEVVEPKQRVVEKKPDADYAKQRREAQARRRMGAPEGRAQGAGMSQSAYGALLAAAIRRHAPGGSFGEGTAFCTFHVTADGHISGISASGSAPAYAALARRILASVHAPPPPGGGLFASQRFTFH
ncbi:MAG: hypothetical protein HYS06_07125 [Methylocystis sp.]|nr:hypothetical protein [Methylocystis sp.]MBI3275235.1 hypothetical protein [Methylocystis sp.]